DSNSITIIGSDNVVAGGLSNVNLLNTSGLTAEESDITYLNGCFLTGCGDPATVIAERSGKATLEDGTTTVTDDRVTADSIILLTATDAITGTLAVSASSGSFTITSSNSTDAG